jgi:3-hydroxy-9,10-secoandrosta-1,3,5(10)-triene-9,17-dione monooxygenase reductase component
MWAEVDAREQVQPDEFRRVLGNLVTGVTVLTAYTPTGPTGLTANSVTSVSLAPPMILACPAKTSLTWPDIKAAGRFCVNVLAAHHDQLCRRFAQRDVDRFAGLEWNERPAGPALTDAVAWIDCVIHAEHHAGDHTIVVAKVVATEAAEVAAPLVFFQGRYLTLADRRKSGAR